MENSLHIKIGFLLFILTTQKIYVVKLYPFIFYYERLKNTLLKFSKIIFYEISFI